MTKTRTVSAPKMADVVCAQNFWGEMGRNGAKLILQVTVSVYIAIPDQVSAESSR
jgi:hypothetical protein